MENVDSHQLALRSEMLSVLSDFSVEQLQDKEGRQSFLDQLRDAMNAKLEELEGLVALRGSFYILCGAIRIRIVMVASLNSQRMK